MPFTISSIAVAEARQQRLASCPAHFGHVVLRLEPAPDIAACEFVNEVDDAIVPEYYIAGIREAVQQVADKKQLVNVRVRLLGATLHPVIHLSVVTRKLR